MNNIINLENVYYVILFNGLCVMLCYMLEVSEFFVLMVVRVGYFYDLNDC